MLPQSQAAAVSDRQHDVVQAVQFAVELFLCCSAETEINIFELFDLIYKTISLASLAGWTHGAQLMVSNFDHPAV